MKQDDILNPETRAEDIILGGLGFSESARIISISHNSQKGVFFGVGEYNDGEQFDFHSEDPISSLEEWALTILSERDSSQENRKAS
jgi:hypothetical protein